MRRSFALTTILGLLACPAACGDSDTDTDTSATATDATGDSTDVAATDAVVVAPITPAAKEVGTAGGTVQAGAASVMIPKDALTAMVEVSVSEAGMATAAVPAGSTASSPAVAITPHGQTFKVPVTLTIPYDGQGDTVLRLADDKDDTWEPVDGVTFGADTVQVQTTTFSIYIVVSRCSQYCPHAASLCGISRGACQSSCASVAMNGPQSPACVANQTALLACYATTVAAGLDCTTGLPLDTTCPTERAAAMTACGVTPPTTGPACPCFTQADLDNAYTGARDANVNGVFGNSASDWGECTFKNAPWADVTGLNSIWFASRPAAGQPMNWEGNFSAGTDSGSPVCGVWSEQQGVPGVGGPAFVPFNNTLTAAEASACVALLNDYAVTQKGWTCVDQH